MMSGCGDVITKNNNGTIGRLLPYTDANYTIVKSIGDVIDEHRIISRLLSNIEDSEYT